MIALRYVDGALTEETGDLWCHPVVRLVDSASACKSGLIEPRMVTVTLSHRERRGRARRGRRFPIRVQARALAAVPVGRALPVIELVGHQLRRGDETAVTLFLPSGEALTRRHCLDVAAWIDGRVGDVPHARVADLIDMGYRVIGCAGDGFVAWFLWQRLSGIVRTTLNAAFAECASHSLRMLSRRA